MCESYLRRVKYYFQIRANARCFESRDDHRNLLIQPSYEKNNNSKFSKSFLEICSDSHTFRLDLEACVFSLYLRNFLSKLVSIHLHCFLTVSRSEDFHFPIPLIPLTSPFFLLLSILVTLNPSFPSSYQRKKWSRGILFQPSIKLFFASALSIYIRQPNLPRPTFPPPA
jgi:hypothetical protein